MDEKIESLIKELTAKLGTTGTQIWSATLRQAKISAITTLLVGTVIGILDTFYIKYVINALTFDHSSRECIHNGAVDLITIVFGVVLTVITLVFIFEYIGNILTAIFNPNFWAFEKIMEKITN